MQASAESKNWIYAGYKHHHYGHGDGFLLIEFQELFQFYQQDSLDKTIASAYFLLVLLSLSSSAPLFLV
jgi:hypothetical protein